MAKVPEFKVGDKVAYSAQSLRSTGQYTGDVPHARGVVKSLKKIGRSEDAVVLVEVDWGDAELPQRVAAANLAHVGPNVRFCCV